MIAIRDLDPRERIALRDSGIKVFTMRDIDELGMAGVMRTTSSCSVIARASTSASTWIRSIPALPQAWAPR